MHAVLDDAETPRFERLLSGFLREYHVSFMADAGAAADQILDGARTEAETVVLAARTEARQAVQAAEQQMPEREMTFLTQ